MSYDEQNKIRLQKSRRRTKCLFWAAVTVEAIKTGLMITLAIQVFTRY